MISQLKLFGYLVTFYWFILENESFCPQGVNTICWWKEREQGKCFISDDNIPPKMNRCFFIASSSLYQGKIKKTPRNFCFSCWHHLVRQSSWESVITSLMSCHSATNQRPVCNVLTNKRGCCHVTHDHKWHADPKQSWEPRTGWPRWHF